MKRKVLIIGITGLVLLGGAVGVGAFSGSNSNDDTAQQTNSKVISTDKAKEIATNKVKGTVEEVELEKDDGRLKYEVDLSDQNGEVDVDVDAKSGAVIKVDRDDDDNKAKGATVSAAKVNNNQDDDDDNRAKLATVSAAEIKNSQDDDDVDDKRTKVSAPATANVSAKKDTRLSRNDAIAIATKSTPGKVVEVEYDDGEYEIEIITSTHKVEYEIDARTGRILEKDVENLHDDDDDDRYDDQDDDD